MNMTTEAVLPADKNTQIEQRVVLEPRFHTRIFKCLGSLNESDKIPAELADFVGRYRELISVEAPKKKEPDEINAAKAASSANCFSVLVLDILRDSGIISQVKEGLKNDSQGSFQVKLLGVPQADIEWKDAKDGLLIGELGTIETPASAV